MTRKQDGLRGLARAIEEVAREHPSWSQAHEVVIMMTSHLSALARVAEINQDEAMSTKVLEFDYLNWSGKQSHRNARPLTIRWGTSDWYLTPQWLLSAWDLDKNDVREFRSG